MNQFDIFTKAALEQSFLIMGETIQYKTQDIPAIVSDVKITEDLIDGGIMEKRGIKVVIEKTAFIIPAVGEKIIYNAKPFRVIESAEDSVSWELTCDTSDK